MDVFEDLEEILRITTSTLMRIEHETILELLKTIFNVYKELFEGPCEENQARLTSSEAIATITSLLYNIQKLESQHVPAARQDGADRGNFVDTLTAKPPGTFKPSLPVSCLSPDVVLEIKEGIYGLFTSLLDGSDSVVAKNLAMHLDPLCLLRY